MAAGIARAGVPHLKDEKPLFIPLKREFYFAFVSGRKDTEYRRYGSRWNERTCRIGRRVILSKGYSGSRRTGEIMGFERKRMDSADWLACYGKPGDAACIKIRVVGETWAA